MEPTLQTALHHQMSLTQDLVKRMAENSRNVKTWCVTIVSALLAFSTKTLPLPWFMLVLPILPLMYLDMYYLALESFYRDQYNELKTKYKENKISEKNVYDLESPNGNLDILLQLNSKSIWPFYGLLMVIAGFIGYFLANQLNCLGV